MGRNAKRRKQVHDLGRQVKPSLIWLIRSKRVAGVREGDIYGQILCARILRFVCGHYLHGIRDVAPCRKPEESGIRESSFSKWRIFAALQGETMDDWAQGLVGKMIGNAGHLDARLTIGPFSEWNGDHSVDPFLRVRGAPRQQDAFDSHK
jgi:hypothetical protein